MSRRGDRVKMLWIGFLGEPINAPAAQEAVQRKAAEFHSDLWRQLVSVANTAASALQKEATKKSMGQRVVGNALLGRSRVFDAILEQGNLQRPDEIERVLESFCSISLCSDRWNGKVYLYAVAHFSDPFLHDQFQLQKPQWPRAGVTVSQVSRLPGLQDMATPCGRDRGSSPAEKNVIHEILRRKEDAPVGWWKAMEALLLKVRISFSSLTERQRETAEPFFVGREPAFTISKYLERVYLYSGQNAYSRIMLGLLYLERLMNGGCEEGFVRAQSNLRVSEAASGTLQAPSRTPAARSQAGQRLMATPLPQGDEAPADDAILRQILHAIHRGARSNHSSFAGTSHWLLRDWAELEPEWDALEADAASRARKLLRHAAARFIECTPVRPGPGHPGDEAKMPQHAEDEDLGDVSQCALVPENTRIPITELTLHKSLLTCVLLATKQHDDTLRSNQSYAAIGGFPHGQLDRMEVAMLRLLQYDLWVEPSFFKQFSSELRRFADIYVDKEVRTVCRREWDFLVGPANERRIQDPAHCRYVDLSIHRLLSPAELGELAGVLRRYKDQCRDELRELERQSMHRTHRSQLLAEQDQERRRVIEKRFGSGHVPPDSGEGDKWTVSQEEAAKFCEFAATLPDLIEAAWTTALRLVCSRHGPASVASGSPFRNLAVVCNKKWISPAQLPGQLSTGLLEATLGSEHLGAAEQVSAVMEAYWRDQAQTAGQQNSPSPQLRSSVTITGAKKTRSIAIDCGSGQEQSVALGDLECADLTSMQAICRQYITENGFDLPEETLGSPFASSFRMGMMSPRMSTVAMISSGMAQQSPCGSPHSPAPRQVSHYHGIAASCDLGASNRFSPAGVGEPGSPYQRTMRKAHDNMWTKISTGRALTVHSPDQGSGIGAALG
eukprot:TRINITY_DN21922_c0_g2_i1.p1 TRINITY_DN21922_c0_g2~~TRINITY_DN21922_c0_g2_i1.p1  ORF type:complete len:933 (+),score=328.61 TRINITY_DN21922_c0_g2_i1:109-2799(+)